MPSRSVDFAYSLHLRAWLLIALSLCWHVCAYLGGEVLMIPCTLMVPITYPRHGIRAQWMRFIALIMV